MADMKPHKTEETPSKPTTEVAVKRSNKPLIIAIVISAVLGLMLVIAVGALTFTAISHNANNHRNAVQNDRMTRPENSSMTGPMGERRGSRNENGPVAMGDSSTRVNGVVTAINGDTITVVGNGKQMDVKKTSSTTIRGTSDALAVNDTVSMVGTTTNGIFTVTSITIRNVSAN